MTNEEERTRLRQRLALITDQLIQVKELEIWESVAATQPELQARLAEAINSADSVWWLWRSLTAKDDVETKS